MMLFDTGKRLNLFLGSLGSMAALVRCQGNKGGRGQRNREEIEAGATRNLLHGRAAFLSSLYAYVRIALVYAL